uniref:Glycerate kinase n=1 Tax=Pyxicephalus adspersus TaxID=30357 RepID=A0AAV2ZWM9_PYXAD|nr:TPA: hypothetical protein GDO54_016647 [Pyxicephalus adspersus]
MARVLRILTPHRLLRCYHGTLWNMANLQDDAQQIFRSAVSAVLPPRMLQRALSVRERGGSAVLECGGREIPLDNNLHLVGFGKAVLGMAAAAERIVGRHLVGGVISIPQGMQDSLQRAERSSAPYFLDWITNLLFLFLVLCSGGGSALLPAPLPPLTLQEKQTISQQLAQRGATIQELNTIRRALSSLKGGGLARAAYPAQVVTLILSDVIGDDLEVIASGPTVPSAHSAVDCLQILDKYNLSGSGSVDTAEVVISRGPPEGPNRFSHVHNILIGSNLIALQEAERESQRLGYLPLLLSNAISGDVTVVSRFFALLARVIASILGSDPHQAQLEQEILSLASTMAIPSFNLAKQLQEVKKASNIHAVCALFGGETTVQVRGEGKGGRNQELALRVAMEWQQSPEGMMECEVLFLSGGTDGQDGPTEAAGASCYPQLVAHAMGDGLDVQGSLNASDSNGFFSQFQKGRHLLVTGLTGTNVMDVQVLLVRRQAKDP